MKFFHRRTMDDQPIVPPPPTPTPTYSQPPTFAQLPTFPPQSSLEVRLYDLEKRLATLEDHERRSWVFSTKLLKRAVGISGDLLFLLILLGLIGLSGYGIYALMSS